MINANMKSYNYFTFGELDAYGQEQLSTEPVGTITISINLLSKTNADNIKYEDATYIGLTHNANIDNTYVIEYGAERLKVLYVIPFGRYKQVFLKEML